MWKIITIVLIATHVYAAPYLCSNGAIFEDNGLCQSVCGGTCTELEQNQVGKQACNTLKYKGFIYYNNKTYAVTTSQGVWDGGAKIYDSTLNTTLAKMLSYYGVGAAWIGAYDPNKSSNYNSVNPDRFVWHDGTAITWSNWAAGEPNNKLIPDDIGTSPIYGEHWVMMYSSGLWNDDMNRDYYALVEFDEELACVAGIPDNKPDNEEFINNTCTGADCEVCMVETASGIRSAECKEGVCPINRAKCDTSIICLGGTYGNTTQCMNSCQKMYILPSQVLDSEILDDFTRIHSTEASVTVTPQGYIIKVTEIRLYYDLVTRTSKEILFTGSTISSEVSGNVKFTVHSKDSIIFVDVVGRWGSSLYGTARFEFTVEPIPSCTSKLTCPLGNYSCVQTGTDYFCSSEPCASPSTGFVSEPDSYEDVKDDGEKDADGNCLGQVYLFSGIRQTCRYVSPKTGFFNCCETNKAYKTQFRCDDQGQTYEDAAKCGEICGKPCDLMKTAPPDLENFFGLFKCDAQEKQLAFKRSMFPSDGGCRYIGKYCSERWKIGFTNICVQERGSYCCFDSPLAKIIIEAAHVQLGISWGSAKNPNCAGLKPEEFQKLDLDKVDFSNWIDNYVTPAVSSQMQKAMERLEQ